MVKRRSAVPLFAAACFMTAVADAQVGLDRDVAPLKHWAAPLHWLPTEAEARDILASSDPGRIRADAASIATAAAVTSLRWARTPSCSLA